MPADRREQLLVNHEMDGTDPSTDLHSSPTNFYSYPHESWEEATAPRRLLDSRAFHTQDARSPHEQNVSVPSSSPYYAIDGSPISSTTAYQPLAHRRADHLHHGRREHRSEPDAALGHHRQRRHVHAQPEVHLGR